MVEEARAKLKELLASCTAAECMIFSKKYPGITLGDFVINGVDYGYTQWVIRQWMASKGPQGVPCSHNFEQAARFFQSYYIVSRVLGNEEHNRFTAMVLNEERARREEALAVKKRADEEALAVKKRADELKRLRRSTTAAQFEWLGQDLLFAVLKHTNMLITSRIPLVSKAVALSAGSCLVRMPIMAKFGYDVYHAWLLHGMNHPKSKTKTGVPYLEYASGIFRRFVVDKSVEMNHATTCDEFVRLAMRSCEHRSDFKRLKTDLTQAVIDLNTYQRVVKKMVSDVVITGKRKEVDAGGGHGECTRLNKAVGELVVRRQNIARLLTEMKDMNKLFDLRARVPSGNYTSESGMKAMERFLHLRRV